MYRNTKTGGFNSPFTGKESTSCGSETDPETIDGSKNPISKSVRSTSKILTLFKKPTEISHQNESTTVNDNRSKHNSTEAMKHDIETVKENMPTPTSSDKIIFNVVIGKKSTRKHKVWDDDGILEVNGRSAVLKSVDGNIISRTKLNPESLAEGFRFCMDNKEIEIVDRMSETGIQPRPPVEEVVREPPLKKLKASFVSPLVGAGSLKKGLKLSHEPLVMPPLMSSKRWLEQKETIKEHEVSVDPCLASILRPHQREGVVFLYECLMGLRTENYYGAILADEMGLGKTLQCIAIIWTLLKKGPYGKPVIKRVLIVAPSSLCENWNKEFAQWLGYHRISPYVVNAKNKPSDFKKQPRNSVMIISYDMLIRCQEEIQKLGFDVIICDEGHRLKNNDIKAAKFLHNMECKKRILLSGTPIQNDLQEFYSLTDFVNPGILGNSYEYKSYYEDTIVASQRPDSVDSVISLGEERATELNKKTRSFILRRTQDTINQYLPSKHEIIMFCALSAEQEQLYSLVTDAWFKKTAIPGSNIQPLTAITALKKICNYADLFKNEKNDFLNPKSMIGRNVVNTSADGYLGKITVVRTLMKNLKKTDEKLVLISYFTSTLDVFETVCNSEALKFLRLDGNTPNNARTKIVEHFNSPSDNHKVFLLSAKAGGVGLNLPGASRLVLFDSAWNPASDTQAMARIWRDGQKKDVYIYRLLTTGTIEEKIFQRQISKAGLSETVVDLNHFASMKLSTSELKDLFTLRTDTNCLTHDLMKCSCGGIKIVDNASEKSAAKTTREFQFNLEEEQQPNLTINHLLKWEHYKQTVPKNILQEMMVEEISNHITFVLKNSVLQKNK